MVMTPMIRPFCLQDTDRLAALWHASWRSTGVQAAAQMTAADLRQRVDEELSAGWEVFVAEHEGDLLGFLALKRASRCLDQLFVAPDAKRLGVGKKLFDLAENSDAGGFLASHCRRK
jgi:GNAT superfamily N-acetyltransferase